MCFFYLQLTASIYKKVLVILHEKVMPFMSNPLLLSDFLTTSYDIGRLKSMSQFDLSSLVMYGIAYIAFIDMYAQFEFVPKFDKL